MSPALASFLFEVANFLLLAGALGWLLFKPVRRALDEERDRHVQVLRDAERLRAEASAEAAQARSAREAAAAEAAERRREALEAAQRESARLVDEARAAQAAERHALERQLQSARVAEANALAETLGRVAATSVARLLAMLDGPSLDLAMVRAACLELEKIPRPSSDEVLVESARPLEAGSRALLTAAVGAGFAERTVAGLGAGVRIMTPSGQIDASASGLARYAAREVIGATAPGEGREHG